MANPDVDDADVLTAAFLSRWPPTAPQSPEDKLANALAEALALAQASWPVLQIPPAVFVAYLAERADSTLAPVESLAATRVTDLFLACGCASGDARALALFDGAYFAKLRAAALAVEPSPAFADDVIQEMRVFLMVGQEAKIAQYRGRGPLKAWLETTVKRLALAHKRRRQPYDEVDEIADMATAADPELEQLRIRFTDDFRQVVRQAVSEALVALAPEERNLLRWHLLDNVSLRRLAVIRGANVSTVSRDFARVRATILAHVRTRLMEHTRLPGTDVDAVMGALLSRISISIGGILKAQSGPRS